MNNKKIVEWYKMYDKGSPVWCRDNIDITKYNIKKYKTVCELCKQSLIYDKVDWYSEGLEKTYTINY